MPARRRRAPRGTEAPAGPITSDEHAAVTGTIEAEKIEARALVEPKIEPDQEHVIVVPIDDDWLDRLELPGD